MLEAYSPGEVAIQKLKFLRRYSVLSPVGLSAQEPVAPVIDTVPFCTNGSKALVELQWCAQPKLCDPKTRFQVKWFCLEQISG